MNSNNYIKRFHCQVCNINVENWVTTEIKIGILTRVDIAILYCPRCGAFLGKQQQKQDSACKINEILAVSNVKGNERIEIVTNDGIVNVRVGETFYYKKAKLHILFNGVNYYLEQYDVFQGKWKKTTIKKKSMADCLIFLTKNMVMAAENLPDSIERGQLYGQE